LTSAFGSAAGLSVAVDFCIIENGKLAATAVPPATSPERRRNARRSMVPDGEVDALAGVAAGVCFLISFIVFSSGVNGEADSVYKLATR
jgi:hypothetical protein